MTKPEMPGEIEQCFPCCCECHNEGKSCCGCGAVRATSPPAPSAGHVPIDWDDLAIGALQSGKTTVNETINYLRERMEGKA